MAPHYKSCYKNIFNVIIVYFLWFANAHYVESSSQRATVMPWEQIEEYEIIDPFILEKLNPQSEEIIYPKTFNENNYAVLSYSRKYKRPLYERRHSQTSGSRIVQGRGYQYINSRAAQDEELPLTNGVTFLEDVDHKTLFGRSEQGIRHESFIGHNIDDNDYHGKRNHNDKQIQRYDISTDRVGEEQDFEPSSIEQDFEERRHNRPYPHYEKYGQPYQPRKFTRHLDCEGGSYKLKIYRRPSQMRKKSYKTKYDVFTCSRPYHSDMSGVIKESTILDSGSNQSSEQSSLADV